MNGIDLILGKDKSDFSNVKKAIFNIGLAMESALNSRTWYDIDYKHKSPPKVKVFI